MTTSAPTHPGTPTRQSRALAFGLCTAVVAVAFEVISVATAMPAAARELDGLSLYAWAFSLFAIGQLFATVAAGRLCDRIGPARPMAGGLALFTVGIVVAATAPTMIQLISGRLLQGLGSGLTSIAMYVVIARAFDESYRPTMFSWISAAWVLPSFIGPVVAAFLTHHFGWRWVFWSVLPLVAIGALLMLPLLFRIADGPVERDGAVAVPPAPLWAAGLAAVGAAAIQLAGQRPGVFTVLGGFVGVVAVGVALPRLMPPRFFRFGPGLPPVIVVRFLMAGAFFGTEAFVPLMLVEQRGLALLLAGSALTIGSLGWTVGSWLQSRRFVPLRREQLISLGAASVAVGVAVVAMVAYLEWWVWVVGVAWIIAGFGMGIATASTSIAMMTLSAEVDQGRNSSSLQFGEAFGGGLFIGLGGTLFAALHPSGNLALTFGTVIAAMAFVGLLGALASLRTGPIRTHSAG